ncbi:ASCH domain-containing protein [Streptomyces sp. TLI_185]|uniref:ASCH domain-containing protein n=1 Tax=Streptomyces sp. TLI_185 TaxID=2485151 RepID=UPI000F4EECE4|nr:ASCH domain-containing protein [Streptomyces sp. TLI_185]RPF31537.1 ASCH domain-containing protein [Streptomyces sp. TLI_185]
MTTAPERPEVCALTLWQPWASCIAYGTKRIENRRWATDYRGWLLIHAGAILGWARLDDCHQDDGMCTLWSAPGQWHWHLADVHRLARPVSCPGARGLWTPTPALLDLVREAARA